MWIKLIRERILIQRGAGGTTVYQRRLSLTQETRADIGSRIARSAVVGDRKYIYISASEMTCIVSGGALNSTHLLRKWL